MNSLVKGTSIVLVSLLVGTTVQGSVDTVASAHANAGEQTAKSGSLNQLIIDTFGERLASSDEVDFEKIISENYHQAPDLPKVDTSQLDVEMKQLTPYEKEKIIELTTEEELTRSEQMVAAQYYLEHNAMDQTKGLKTFVLKKAFKLAAKMAGKRTSAAYLSAMAAKMAGAENDANKAVTSFLRSLGVSKKKAKKIAKVVVAIAL